MKKNSVKSTHLKCRLYYICRHPLIIALKYDSVVYKENIEAYRNQFSEKVFVRKLRKRNWLEFSFLKMHFEY